MKNKYFYFSLIFSILLFPSLLFADMGMVIWPPKVHLDQSAQNAIVAWDGQEEIIILSVDVESDATATALRILPLPSNPSEIKEGSFDSFEKLVEIMNKKIEVIRAEFRALGEEATAPTPGVEITFHEKIGAHDVTVVKVNDADYFINWIGNFAIEKGLEVKQISEGFKKGVENYLKRDLKYFVFDIIEIKKGEESINPLIYRFESDYFYYPMLISGISEIAESKGTINVFVIAENEIPETPFHQFGFGWWGVGVEIELTQEELGEVNEDIAGLFSSGAKVRKISYHGNLNIIKKDFMIYPPGIWKKYLSLGSYGEEARALQRILINEGLWEAEVGATGYFGSITKETLVKFQEKHSSEILRPIGLEKGTGYYGEKTKACLEQLSIKIKEIKEKAKWIRNLAIEMRGDDVKALQEILIKEGVWERPDIEATNYFGPITKAALIKFQEKYSLEILKPLGLIKGTGFVGPSTRAYLEKISKE